MLVADPQLAAVNGDDRLPDLAIGRLPGRRYILTNGSRKHAENVA